MTDVQMIGRHIRRRRIDGEERISGPDELVDAPFSPALLPFWLADFRIVSRRQVRFARLDSHTLPYTEAAFKDLQVCRPVRALRASAAPDTHRISRLHAARAREA